MNFNLIISVIYSVYVMEGEFPSLFFFIKIRNVYRTINCSCDDRARQDKIHLKTISWALHICKVSNKKKLSKLFCKSNLNKKRCH